MDTLPFDLVRVAVAALVVPPLFFYTRRIREVPGRMWWFGSIALIYATYVLAVVADFVAPQFFYALQPVCLAVAGAFAVVAIVKTRRYVDSQRESK